MAFLPLLPLNDNVSRLSIEDIVNSNVKFIVQVRRVVSAVMHYLKGKEKDK
jgi:hypothetical protein